MKKNSIYAAFELILDQEFLFKRKLNIVIDIVTYTNATYIFF